MGLLSKAKSVVQPVATATSKLATKARIKSPKLFIFGGIGLMVAGAVYACVKTPEAHEVLKETGEEIEKAETRTEKAKALGKGVLKTVTIYSGPMIVGTVGIGGVLFGVHLFDARLATVGAIAVTAENRYKALYSRVKEQYGEEEANHLADGTVQEVVVKTDEKGKEKKEIVRVLPKGVDGFGPYSFVWEECNLEKGVFSDDPWKNKMFLIAAQERCNVILHEQGYIFLNDVLKIFGFKYKVKEGQYVGWIYSDKSRIIGDHAVDCGVAMSKSNSLKHADYLPHILFLEGKEPNVLLDFNCDGYILDECERLNLL